jgi:hypothetical protein
MSLVIFGCLPFHGPGSVILKETAVNLERVDCQEFFSIANRIFAPISLIFPALLPYSEPIQPALLSPRFCTVDLGSSLKKGAANLVFIFLTSLDFS